jgi:hypothetical protein
MTRSFTPSAARPPCLLHIVDDKAVSLPELVDDDLAGESAAHLEVREGFLNQLSMAPMVASRLSL